MASLTANVSADATEFPTDTADPAPGSTWTIGSESISVQGVAWEVAPAAGLRRLPAGEPRKVWLVERGFAGSTKATHSSGATLTQYYADAPAASEGAAQTVSLLGPFHVAFDTPGIGSSEDGALLALLDAGQIVVQVAVVPTISWDGGTSLTINLGADEWQAPDDIFSVIATVQTGDLGINTNPGYAIGIATATFGALENDGALIAQCSGTFTVGAADIYALIATPA